MSRTEEPAAVRHRMRPPSRMGDAARTALALGGAGASLGLLVNAFSPAGVSTAWVSGESRIARVMEEHAGKPGGAPSVPALSLAELVAAQSDSASLILDARSALAFETARIPRARRLSRDAFDTLYRELQPELGRAARIIVYCDSSGCDEARLVAEALRRLGHDTTRLFAGGWQAWSAAGLPSEP